MDAVVCPPVKAVVPPFDVIVRSYGQHVDGPAGRRPHCAGNPGVSYALNKFSKSCGVISNAISVGSSGLSCCLSLFAALAMFSGFGREGQGFSSIRSSSSTSLTMAGAGRNKLSRASCNSKIV